MYETFYGFSAPPFQLSPDHRFFFESSVHRTALAHLSYGLDRGEGFIVITGEVGAGKTTLVGHLLETLDRSRFVAARVVSTQLQGDDMLRMVAAAFGLPIAGAGKADLLGRVEAFLLASQAEGRRCLLAVDEAQNLSVPALEELRMLSNFQSGAQAPLQSFLLGQPQFRATIAGPDLEQLRQRVIASYHLGPLAAGETRRYVEHRLAAVGWRGDPALGEGAFAAIHAATGGVPRRINTLCSRVLLLGFLEELHALDARHVERVAAELAAELDFGPALRAGMPPARASQAGGQVARAAARDATARQPQPPRHPGRDDALERIASLERRIAARERAVARQERLLLQAIGAATTMLDAASG
ncbi:MAG: XrtA/PEP-CTERM system-associated ATPase [Alphaproteobacteria bacterium]